MHERPETSLSVKIAAGLLAGLAVGLVASATGVPWLMRLAVGIEPAGTIWINLIRMTVIPLVVAALVSGVASIGDARRLGRLGVRTLAFYCGTLIIGAFVGLLLALLILPLAPIPADLAGSLRGAAAAGAREIAQQAHQVRGFRQFLLDLVPTNPVQAAAEGALLPVIVFSVLFGAGVAGLDERPRQAILSLADAVAAALIRLVGWIMVLAPLGVACLAAPVAARFGWAMLASLAAFVAVVLAGIILFGIVVYGGAVRLLARVGLVPFARTIAPAQAVGFTTGSSIAALPAMMDAAVRKLDISAPVASFVLPLGAALNRPGTAIYHTSAALFIASLYGISLSGAQLAIVLSSTFLMTFSVAAIPSASVFTLAPTLLAAGLPVEGIALLLGVDRIPDMFRTGLNVTGHLTAAVVVARGEGEAIG
ncbi:MAG: dicarboxylate/amino acid:cation symporter [Gemmatimonadetes bacterium]|nr:dicarboxylate/amino acid:cation symporter [Gemmatimonadota bacterium]